ncbi:nucleotide-binding alpha-beta plait domain-containing protein [Tanacetum coccineum]
MKCTTAIRQLAYGTTPDAFDEYLQMSERTARIVYFILISALFFVPCRVFKKATTVDVENIYNKHLTTHGFSGMLGSIDCMHWEWKNCPVSWQGQYGRGDKKYPTIMLEAVASQDLWIWHAFFGVAGYYLADGIYPQWATFVKSFTVANDAKHAYFKKRQEGARKDVERAFGVLQGRWGIIQQPARSYHVNTLRRVMYSCIILHNMILKDQKMAVFDWNEVYANPSRNMQRTWIERCETQRRKNKEMRDRDTHLSLQQNLMEHIWQEAEHEDEDF